MKIAFLTYDFPWPTNTGGKNRAYNLIKFAKGDFQIFLYSFVREDFDKSYKKQLEKMGVMVKTFPRKKVASLSNLKALFSASSVFYHLYFNKNFEKELLEDILKNKIDVVHFESFYTGYYLSDKIKNLGAKQIFGTENVEHLLYKQYSSSKKVLGKLMSLQANKVKQEEQRFVSLADATLAITEAEQKVFDEMGAKKSFVVENGVDLENFDFKNPQKTIGKKLLFVGNFSYFPNVDAISFFYYDVFSRLDDYELVVVGKEAGKLPFITDPRVSIVPFVPDIKDVYYDADILVSPVRIGGGTNFKILEAMACGLPIVAHPARIGSLGLKAGEHLQVAITKQETIEKLKELENFTFRKKMVESAREYVEEHYSWEVIGKKMHNIWKNL